LPLATRWLKWLHAVFRQNEVEKKYLARGKFKSPHFLIIDIALSDCGDELRIFENFKYFTRNKGLKLAHKYTRYFYAITLVKN
jgi:uncharacterized protein YmfQ (DUF2313 family)